MLTSDQLVALIEARLTENGVAKVVPGADRLATAYRRAYQIGLLNRAIEEAAEVAARRAQAVELPDDLAQQVEAWLRDHPEDPWDDAIAELVDDALAGSAE